MVYFCGFARSEIIRKNTRELGVGRGQFHSGVNGLIRIFFPQAHQLLLSLALQMKGQ